MNTHLQQTDFGNFPEPATLKIERLLPGPIERVWSYLTDGELRKQWFASGDMKLDGDAPFELVWRDSDWATPAGKRPESVPDPRRMQCRVLACEPPHKLNFTWGEKSEINITLEQRGERVLLTLVHLRIADRLIALNVSSGWHAHLDMLAAQLGGAAAPAFWDNMGNLKAAYEKIIPAA